MNVRLAIISLVVTGCAYSPPPSPAEEDEHSLVQTRPYSASLGCRGSFRIAPGFSSEQVDGIHNAASRWNVFLGRAYFSISDAGTCPIVPLDLPGELGAELDHDRGRVGVDLEHLDLFDRVSGPRFETAIMHEMGHSLGMEHVEHALMAPNGLTLSEDFTENDQAECVRIGFCS